MKGIVLAEGFAELVRVPISCNKKDGCIYFHFDLFDEPLESIYKSECTHMEISFFDLLFYGLDHEEIHLVLSSMGEDEDDGLDTPFISKVMHAFWFGYSFKYQRRLSYGSIV